MEEFISTVKPQVVPLSNYDMITHFTNIQCVFTYENKGGTSDFMPPDSLEQSFYKALQQFPILAGLIARVGSNKLNAVIDKNKLNIPEYLESTSDIHYSELKEANFSWDKWPKNIEMSPISTVDTAGTAKNVKVCIVRLKDNSGLVISLVIAHILVDAIGYFTFYNLWADICKDMRNGGNNLSGITKPLVFDRGILNDNLPEKRKPLDSTTRWFYTHSNMLSTMAAWLPFPTRAYLINKIWNMTSNEAHMFHISRESLDSMHASVRKLVPSDMRISDNDLLTALLYKTFAQSKVASSSKSILDKIVEEGLKLPMLLISGQKNKQVLGSITCDIRPRLGIRDANYMGSAAVGVFMKYPSNELTAPTSAESLAAVAMHVRQLVDTIDGAYIGSLMDAMDSNPSFHTQSLGCAIKYDGCLFSNHTRLSMYDADFGNGAQQWSSFIPKLKFGMVLIQPCPPGVDGVNIFVDTRPTIVKNILSNEYWMTVAKLVY